MQKLRKNLSYKGQIIYYNLILKDQKYIRIKTNEDEIVVSAPFYVKDWEIEHLIYKNIAKILKILEFKEIHKKFEIAEEGFIKIFDEKIPVSFKSDAAINLKYVFKLYDETEITIKHMYKKLVQIFLNIFEKRMQHWKEIMNLNFKNLSIKEIKGKWGVCFPEKSKIVLNIRLIHYPQICLDYVIVHELSHLIHKNHSKDFWYLVQKYLPDYKKYSDMLKVKV